MDIRIDLPGVKLGFVEADSVRVEPSLSDLVDLISETCEAKRKQFTVATLADAEAIQAVRAMFREWGMDPSKYRPSSEALLRRVIQGKGLYFISNIVDIVNLGSIETAWPYGCYDRAKLRPPIAFRHGSAGESYERVGKEMWHLEGRPTLADADGPFGSPISDSIRTMITESATEVLVVIYAPVSARDRDLEQAAQRVADRLSSFGYAAATRTS
ncbi:MAG TPA: phenylalanine--tRNA ligase beta subunit-related protein [Candidatus Acidoferrales bacterium]|nr:phenylalanine--tRNA ligase beta subunit-related protein [Candidatus Acidoferrales bacterium]